MEQLRALLNGGDLVVIEWLRYPIYFILTLLSGMTALILAADFLASKRDSLKVLSDVKKSIYSSKWVVITVSSLLFVFSVFTIIWPSGIADYVFAGDFLFWLATICGGVLLLLDRFWKKDVSVIVVNEDNNEDDGATENMMGSADKRRLLFNRFLWIAAGVIAVITLIHMIVPTIILF